MLSDKIIADSIANDIRLTTLELMYPRFIHSEFMTHRQFSRNTSSSRAIPVKKVLEQVWQNPAIPIHWGKNQPGMQAKEEIASSQVPDAEYLWRCAAQDAYDSADNLSSLGIHKQIVNRLLEPFQYIKVIVTATEWDNFFALRLHSDAQPEMQELARCMWGEISNSIPSPLDKGEWHMPYLTSEDWYGFDTGSLTQEALIKCSVARCAHVTYLNHDKGSPDIEKNIALHDKLLAAGHMSPFEHVATPMEYQWESDIIDNIWPEGYTHSDRIGNMWSGNFRGWIQYRQHIL